MPKISHFVLSTIYVCVWQNYARECIGQVRYKEVNVLYFACICLYTRTTTHVLNNTYPKIVCCFYSDKSIDPLSIVKIYFFCTNFLFVHEDEHKILLQIVFTL